MKWPQTTLGEVFDIARGGSPRPIDKFITSDPDGVNWIMIGDTSDKSKYISSTKKKIIREGVKKSRLVKPGDFLLTNSMSFGRPYILNTHGCIHDGWLVLRPILENVSSDFFYHLLSSDDLYRAFTKQASGAVVKNLNIGLVKPVKIPLPPLAEQKRLAAILDAADALRAKRQQALAHLDDLLQSTFLTLFGDPVTNPMGWEKKTGDELCARITVGIVVKPASHYRESGVPALRSLNVRPNRIELEKLVYFSPEDNEGKLAKTRLKENDILLVRSGQPGTAAVVPKTLDGINAIDLLIATPITEIVNPVYLSHYFNSPGGKKMALGAARGQIQKHLNVGSLKKAEIPFPPLPLQQRFAAIVEKIEAQKARHRAHLAELDTLFASLQSRAFSGEL